MKRFYTQKSRATEVKKSGYDVHTYELDVPSTYGLNYYRKLDQSMKEFFAGLKPTSKPTLFVLEGDFDMLDRLHEDERLDYIVAVVNIFASYLFDDKELEGERRLRAPRTLSEVSLSEMVKLDMVNKQMKFPNFSMEVSGRDSDFLFEVIRIEDTDTDLN